jgi:EAL domain-containing protein (putative c-di-GMP-specific phosphodiesterase class I)
MRAAGLRDARCLAARLNGADFGLLVDGASPSVVTSLVKALHASLMTLHGQSLSPARPPALVGAALLMPGVTAAEALGCADAMLRECELEGTGWRIGTPGRVSLRRTAGQWRRLLDEALSSGRVRLVRHGVESADGVPPHEDTDLEVLDDDGRPVDRAAWQAAALRTQRIDDFDLRNVELALEHLGQQPTPLAVALHVASCVRPSFVRRLGMVLDAAAARRDRLWLELDLGASARAADDVAAVLAELRLRGLRVGVRHAPADPAALDRLAKAGVTHVRMARDVGDASAGAAAEHHRSLERMVGAAGLQVLTPRGAGALA